MKHINYHQVSKTFRHTDEWQDGQPLSFTAEGADIYRMPFISQNARHLVGRPDYRCAEHGLSFSGEPVAGELGDYLIEENIRFKYPLVREISANGTLHRHERVTILLHGLNERSFSKYLPWAYQLWVNTGVPVLLFPLAFHVNRVLPGWAARQQEIFERRSQLPGNDCAHRFNAVISERLEERPERFFWGAVQSYLDLLDLAREIRSGRHPHFAASARLDMFGFSAGGYLALLLLLEDAEGLFTESPEWYSLQVSPRGT